jgi:predicted CXXCH cytochrome family protein
MSAPAGDAQETPRPNPNSEIVPVPATNPHWRRDGCTSCHAPESRKWKEAPAGQVNLLCLKCHDGLHASREPHPIGRSFSSDQVRRPESWPAPDGLLSCITCHDVLRACNESARRPSNNPAMLRGTGTGGVSFCNECHVSEKLLQFNPHVMLRENASDTSKSCLFCHSKEMGADPQTVRSGDPMLIQDEITLCGQCHRRHLDFFDPGHMGATATAAILSNLRSTNAQTLPLSQGKVVCSTCHNPHQAGVFEESTSLGAGAMNFAQ